MTTALLVSPSAAPGGAERAFLQLTQQLPHAGVQPVPVVLADGPLVEWLERSGFRPLVLPVGRARHVLNLAATVRRLAQIARNAHVDAVIGSMSKGHLYGSTAALLAGVPSIWWQQSIPGRTRFDLGGALVPSAAVACVGESVASAQRRFTPRRTLRTINLGIPLGEIRAQRGEGAALRRELGWNGAPVVGIVGRLEPWKGQDVFLRAAKLVAEQHPDARFAVVGGAVLGWEGDYPERLHELARSLGIADRVHFTGHRPDPWRWTDLLDVVVHASFNEPFGLVVLEAMALGKAVVAAAEGGPTEMIEHGRSGLLVAPGNPGTLAATVERVLSDPALRARLGESAYARADDFSDRRMAEHFAALMRELTQRRRRRT